jgi:YD repeat-containing protein
VKTRYIFEAGDVITVTSTHYGHANVWVRDSEGTWHSTVGWATVTDERMNQLLNRKSEDANTWEFVYNLYDNLGLERIE